MVYLKRSIYISMEPRYLAHTIVRADIQTRVAINQNFHGKVNMPELAVGYFLTVVPLLLNKERKKHRQEDNVNTDRQIQYKQIIK